MLHCAVAHMFVCASGGVNVVLLYCDDVCTESWNREILRREAAAAAMKQQRQAEYKAMRAEEKARQQAEQ